MNHRIHTHAARSGTSFLELQVAFVLLGIALAGIVPLVVMQSKQLKAIEGRLSHRQTYYLVPVESAWARKLGTPATIEAVEPARALSSSSVESFLAPSSSSVEPAQELTILSVDKSLTDEAVSVRVRVNEIPEP